MFKNNFKHEKNVSKILSWNIHFKLDVPKNSRYTLHMIRERLIFTVTYSDYENEYEDENGDDITPGQILIIQLNPKYAKEENFFPDISHLESKHNVTYDYSGHGKYDGSSKSFEFGLCAYEAKMKDVPKFVEEWIKFAESTFGKDNIESTELKTFEEWEKDPRSTYLE